MSSRAFNLKRSTVGTFAVPFRVLSQKNMTGDNWYLSRVKKFKPCPQNRILVPLRGSFENFRRASRSFFYASSPLGPRDNFLLYYFYSLDVISFPVAILVYHCWLRDMPQLSLAKGERETSCQNICGACWLFFSDFWICQAAVFASQRSILDENINKIGTDPVLGEGRDF